MKKIGCCLLLGFLFVFVSCDSTKRIVAVGSEDSAGDADTTGDAGEIEDTDESASDTAADDGEGDARSVRMFQSHRPEVSADVQSAHGESADRPGVGCGGMGKQPDLRSGGNAKERETADQRGTGNRPPDMVKRRANQCKDGSWI